MDLCYSGARRSWRRDTSSSSSTSSSVMVFGNVMCAGGSFFESTQISSRHGVSGIQQGVAPTAAIAPSASSRVIPPTKVSFRSSSVHQISVADEKSDSKAGVVVENTSSAVTTAVAPTKSYVKFNSASLVMSPVFSGDQRSTSGADLDHRPSTTTTMTTATTKASHSIGADHGVDMNIVGSVVADRERIVEVAESDDIAVDDVDRIRTSAAACSLSDDGAMLFSTGGDF